MNLGADTYWCLVCSERSDPWVYSLTLFALSMDIDSRLEKNFSINFEASGRACMRYTRGRAFILAWIHVVAGP